MSLQILGGSGKEWLNSVVLLLAPGVVVTVLCAPLLLARRMRSLFEQLPPFESAVATYVLVSMVASLPYVFGLVGALALVGTGKAIFTVTLFVSVCYVVGVPLVAVFGLPRVGIDWDPTGYGVSTWALLVAGVVWYVVLFTVPLAFISLLFSPPVF